MPTVDERIVEDSADGENKKSSEIEPASGWSDDEDKRIRPSLTRDASRRIPPKLKSKVGGSDVVQDAYLGVQKRADEFKKRSAKQRYLILRKSIQYKVSNIIRQFGNDTKRDVSLEHSFEDQIISIQCDDASSGKVLRPSEVLSEAENVSALKNAIDSLDEDEQKIIELRVYGLLKFKEIAERLGIKENTACTTYNRALRKLKGKLSSIDPDRFD